uniref:Uncharacterized protein n=1 Tax=uncultured marine thaumarchaeote KM3_72_A09 TaxID=1456261 RepID=A0A075HL34_9ARCH|nr:hypothetical protein [uncultured marine thaumarchaeote KM3_72_A09]
MAAQFLPMYLLEEYLAIVGAALGFLIAYVSYRGYKQTRSPTLLRLGAAFLLLGISYSFTGFHGLAANGLLPNFAILVGTFAVLAYSLETAGYFFLAFSHMLNVKGLKRGSFVPLVVFSPGAIAAGLKSLSFYFLLYGVTETLLSYVRTRNRGTLVIAAGLAMLATGEFTRWIGFFYGPASDLVLLSVFVKVVGLSTLVVPIMKFMWLGRSMTDVVV